MHCWHTGCSVMHLQLMLLWCCAFVLRTVQDCTVPPLYEAFSIFAQGLHHPCIVGLLEHKIREKPSTEMASSERMQQLWLVLQYCDRGSLEVAPMPLLQACIINLLCNCVSRLFALRSNVCA